MMSLIVGVLEIDDIMNQNMKKTSSNAYFKRLRLLLKSKLKAQNLINVINTWVVAVVRYSGGLIRLDYYYY